MGNGLVGSRGGGASHLAWTFVALIGIPAAGAATEVAPFELGTVLVIGQRPESGRLDAGQTGSAVLESDMRRFNRSDVGAALDLLPGVAVSTNSRNEKTILVRGFDARQVPLFVDGIPVYVPYDGYVDFGRFGTADLAAIQVAKGYSSVAYGPNALGGAINLVTRRPTRAFEADATVGFGSGAERRSSVNLGMKRPSWYLQAGASSRQADGFPLSADFEPTATEDGGARNNARHRDTKLSFKLGLMPNDGDEYVLGYYRQDGEKGQPPSTDPRMARFWTWPYWDKEGAFLTSRTALGAHEVLKLRAYRDRYGNEVDSWTDDTYSTPRTSGRGSVATGRSIYRDVTTGGAVELESRRFDRHALRLVAHFKSDSHREFDAHGAMAAHFEDRLASLGVEDAIRLAPHLGLSLGASRHALRPESVFSFGNPYSLPGERAATDAQAALYYEPADTARLYATIARKTRLPTLKDRYSQRLGTFIENPALRPEQALNYELGYRGRLTRNLEADAAVFLSNITDRIQRVANVSGDLSQMQNVGVVRIAGLELGVEARAAGWLGIGGNYTFTDAERRDAAGARLTDLPRHKLTAHALVSIMPTLELVAFIEHESTRWASDSVRLSGFTTLDLKAVWRPARALSIEAGVGNVTDRNYALAEGFPGPGRTWLASARYEFR